MSLSESLLRDVQLFVSDLGISESALGLNSVNDPSLIAEIRKGRSPTLRTADRIYTYMAYERTRRAEAGARCATACQEGACRSESEAQDREAAIEGAPGWLARLVARFRS